MRYALGLFVLVLVLAAPAGATFAAGPANHTQPAVIGIARVGQQVTSTTGTWSGTGSISYSYQWDRCDALGNSCLVIAGAAQPTYALVAADTGKTIALIVTAKDSSGSSLAAASLLGPIAPASGVASIARPAITGTPTVGSALNVSTGTWTTTPASLEYAWLRCTSSGRACSAIAGATGVRHVVGAADVGHALVVRVRVKAGSSTQDVLSLAVVARAGSPSTTTTAATTTTATTTTAPTTTTTTTTTTPAPASAATRPAVAGTAKVGQRFSYAAPPGASSTTSFQWHRCDATGAHCNSVHGATGVGYRLVVKDVGKTIALTVKTTPVDGEATPAYSSLVGPIAASNAVVASTAQPAVTGKAVQGQTLTATAGTWTKTPASVAYAWQRCNGNGRICAPIDGATSAAYVPVADDVGHALAVLVTATAGSAKATAFSVATDAIQAPPPLAPTAPLVVTGTPKVGQRLTGAAGTWTGTAPISFHYQWHRCDAGGAHCTSVHGATAATYRFGARDVGKTIGLTVTATDGNGTKAAAYASLVGPVAAASALLVSTEQPAVTGAAVVGQTLSATPGTWAPAVSAPAYAWMRCNANSRICVAIADATSATYTLTADDAGHTLIAVVAAKAGASAFSTATAVVKST
ncbi:MAG: hypothetical protein ACRDL2_12590 [Gaiellaceae bacterium]